MWHRGGGIIIPCWYIVFFEKQHIPGERFWLQQSIEFIQEFILSKVPLLKIMQMIADKFFYSMRAGQLNAVKDSINIENKHRHLFKYVAFN